MKKCEVFLVTNATWLIAIAVVSAGLFTGYLMGVSSSPIAGAVFPALLGVAGAIGAGLVHKGLSAAALRESLENAHDVPANMKVRMLDIVQAHSASTWIPGFYAVVVVLFCLACFTGSLIGFRQRTVNDAGRFPTVDQVLKYYKYDEQQPAQRIAVIGLLLRCRQVNMPPSECRSLMKNLALVFNAAKPEAKAMVLTETFKEKVNDLLSSETQLPSERKSPVLLGPAG